jgi:hypothetical protein
MRKIISSISPRSAGSRLLLSKVLSSIHHPPPSIESANLPSTYLSRSQNYSYMVTSEFHLFKTRIRLILIRWQLQLLPSQHLPPTRTYRLFCIHLIPFHMELAIKQAGHRELVLFSNIVTSREYISNYIPSNIWCCVSTSLG